MKTYITAGVLCAAIQFIFAYWMYTEGMWWGGYCIPIVVGFLIVYLVIDDIRKGL